MGFRPKMAQMPQYARQAAFSRVMHCLPGARRLPRIATLVTLSNVSTIAAPGATGARASHDGPDPAAAHPDADLLWPSQCERLARLNADSAQAAAQHVGGEQCLRPIQPI